MALKLLIIHSDNLFRKHLSERVRLGDYRVVEACPDTEARDMIQRSNFDVVLLGVAGSYQTSLALLKTIKELRPYTEVILLTAMEVHSLYDSIQAMQLGAFDDLLVPVDIQALHHRIGEAYQRKKRRVKADRAVIGEQRKQRNDG